MRCITGRVGRSRGGTDEGAGLEVEERVLPLRHEGVQEPRDRKADDQGRGETRQRRGDTRQDIREARAWVTAIPLSALALVLSFFIRPDRKN